MIRLKQTKLINDLDRVGAKTSTLWTKELEKYEYLTIDDLWYKPGAVEQAKFEYCPLSKIFNKGFEEDCKKR